MSWKVVGLKKSYRCNNPFLGGGLLLRRLSPNTAMSIY